ncbi:MAG: MarR family winged helix-turn-helix transcriptional regulator [Planctomycetota bacterium]
MGRLKAEIQQQQPFNSLEEEAFLNLLRTASVLGAGVQETLRRVGLSQPQFNVLRILRGAPEGLSGKEVGKRMVSRVPDVPRLLDRLERDGMIRRVRSESDRRVVLTFITDAGSHLLDQLEEPIPAVLITRMAHMTREQIEQLIELLELAREGAPPLTSDDDLRMPGASDSSAAL